jgi:hypothetical protein
MLRISHNQLSSRALNLHSNFDFTFLKGLHREKTRDRGRCAGAYLSGPGFGC